MAVAPREREGRSPCSVKKHDQYTHRILNEIQAAGDRVSQRSLSREIGIALGLTNLLVRSLVRKGLVRIVRIKPNRVKYLLTAAGITEKTRISRLALQNSIRFYVDARERIRERFEALSNEIRRDRNGAADNPEMKPIVFYGTDEVAEIGYICLRGTDLKLVGVVDEGDRNAFFDVPVYTLDMLGSTELKGKPFCRLVVMAFENIEFIHTRLRTLAIPPERIFWI
jgi:hypothetical protein